MRPTVTILATAIVVFTFTTILPCSSSSRARFIIRHRILHGRAILKCQVHKLYILEASWFKGTEATPIFRYIFPLGTTTFETFNGTISSIPRLHSHEIIIRPSRKEHEGLYICKIKDTAGHVHVGKGVLLLIAPPRTAPRVFIESKTTSTHTSLCQSKPPVTYIYADLANVTCVADGTLPATNISWSLWLNGREFIDHSPTVGRESTFVKSTVTVPVTKKIALTVQCNVYQPHAVSGKPQKTTVCITITRGEVLQRKRLNVTASQIHAELSLKAILHCLVRPVDAEVYRIKWFRGQKQTEKNIIYIYETNDEYNRPKNVFNAARRLEGIFHQALNSETYHELRIVNPSLPDEDFYFCEVFANQQTVQSQSVNLRLIAKPKELRLTDGKGVKLLQSDCKGSGLYNLIPNPTILHCSAFGVRPRCDISWNKGKLIDQRNSSYENGLLDTESYVDVSGVDSGLVKCTIKAIDPSFPNSYYEEELCISVQKYDKVGAIHIVLMTLGVVGFFALLGTPVICICLYRYFSQTSG